MEVRKAFLAKYPDQVKSAFVMYGYAQGEIMARILDTACENSALTRAGVLQAFQSLKDVQTNGLVVPLDYSKPGQIPAREVYVERPDAGVAGGVTQVQPLTAAPFAISYEPTK